MAVWWLSPSTVPRSAAERNAHWLSGDELSFICDARSSDEQHARLCARIMIRSAIATSLGPGIQLSDLKFVKGPFGKPYLDISRLPKRAAYLDFNHTNTDGLIGVAVGMGVKVGLDCEKLSRRPKFDALRVAQRLFSAAEQEELMAIAEKDARDERFIQQWTLKEAFVKATGRGIRAAPGTKMFSILTARHVESDGASLPESLQALSGLALPRSLRRLSVDSSADADADSQFAIVQCTPSDEHVGSVCVQSSQFQAGGCTARWDDLSLNMWSGMPGFDGSELVPTEGRILACT